MKPILTRRKLTTDVTLLSVFDERPIEIPGFTLRARSVDVVGQPTPKQTERAIELAVSAHDAAPYWIGDLLNHVGTRSDWSQEVRDQIIEATGYALEYLDNIAWVSRHVEAPERVIAPSFSHAQEVAKLPRVEQTKYLEAAREKKLTRVELRKAIKTDKRTAVLDSQATLEGMFRVIYADPPWSYRASTAWPDGSHAPAEQHYPSMTMDELCKLPVEAHAMPDAVLFMWVTASMLFENPGPRDIIEAWGFAPKTQYIWDKVIGMPGNYSYVKHELLVVAGRGSATPDIAIEGAAHDSVQAIRREGEHSEKPEHFRRLIEKLYPRGPYLELFARKPVDGWTTFGNDARLWAMEAAR